MADEFDGRLGCSRHLGPVRLLGLNMMLRTGCETCWIGSSFRAECPKASNAIRIQLVESPAAVTDSPAHRSAENRGSGTGLKEWLSSLSQQGHPAQREPVHVHFSLKCRHWHGWMTDPRQQVRGRSAAGLCGTQNELRANTAAMAGKRFPCGTSSGLSNPTGPGLLAGTRHQTLVHDLNRSIPIASPNSRRVRETVARTESHSDRDLPYLHRLWCGDCNRRLGCARKRSHAAHSSPSEPRNIQPYPVKSVMPSNRNPLRNTVDPISSTKPTDHKSIGKRFQRPPRMARQALRIPNAPNTTSTEATFSGAAGINGRYISPRAIHPSSPRAPHARPKAKLTAIARISNTLRNVRIVVEKRSRRSADPSLKPNGTSL